MRLICHIGTPKTGSTFLQNTFAENRQWLHSHGVVYPGLKSRDANHITLFYAAHEGLHDFARDHGLHSHDDVLRFRTKIENELARQVARERAAHTMVLSSENLTGNLTGMPGILNLGELLKPHFDEIKIVVYIRRQDDAILSMYGEYMRRGFNNMAFDEFLAACIGPNSPAPYLYYRRLLSMWIEVFGRSALEVRLYDPSHLKGGDILYDMLDVIFEHRGSPDLSTLKKSTIRNVGLSAPSLEFLRQMHPYIPNRKDGVINPDRAKLGPRIDTLPQFPRPIIGAGHSKIILDHFQHANNWLRQTFFPQSKAPLFSGYLDQTENIGEVSFSEFSEFCAHLLGIDCGNSS